MSQGGRLTCSRTCDEDFVVAPGLSWSLAIPVLKRAPAPTRLPTSGLPSPKQTVQVGKQGGESIISLSARYLEIIGALQGFRPCARPPVAAPQYHIGGGYELARGGGGARKRASGQSEKGPRLPPSVRRNFPMGIVASRGRVVARKKQIGVPVRRTTRGLEGLAPPGGGLWPGTPVQFTAPPPRRAGPASQPATEGAALYCRRSTTAMDTGDGATMDSKVASRGGHESMNTTFSAGKPMPNEGVDGWHFFCSCRMPGLRGD